mgnify:CR=1 FL=1
MAGGNGGWDPQQRPQLRCPDDYCGYAGDATTATVMYDVDIAAARALAPAGFEIVESAPGKAQLAIALVDYRDNDLGTYHEIGTIFFVRPAGGGPDRRPH